jgi:hypothetical protein
MSFLVSTTSADVLVSDLGLRLVHPTVDRDLALEFTAEEIAGSVSLTDLIRDGDLTLKLGTVNFGVSEVDGDYYSPFSLLEQKLNLNELSDEIVTSVELASYSQSTHIYDGVFPIGVSSTTAATRVIICNGASFEAWGASAGDVVVITGGAAAGSYTIESVDSQKNLVVVEPIVTTIGTGTITIYNPTGAKLVGVDSSALFFTSASNLQSVIEDLDAAIGGNNVGDIHEGLDTLAHNLCEDSYQTIEYSGKNVATITVFTDFSLVTRIRRQEFTYLGDGKILTETSIQYDESGIELYRVTDTYSYTGNRVTSVSSVRS